VAKSAGAGLMSVADWRAMAKTCSVGKGQADPGLSQEFQPAIRRKCHINGILMFKMRND